MTLAWKSGSPAGQKMVLLALCDNANDQGECYPSINMLAKKCSMAERTVQQHISDMEADGMVKREMRTGRSTVYHIDPRRFCTPADSAPQQILHPAPAKSAPTPPQNLHPTPADSAPITTNEPSIESSRKPKKRGQAAPDGFSALDALLAAGVERQVAADWLKLRKEKKATVTQTALDKIVSEAALAGLSLEGVLRLCCERGWAGFDAKWVAPRAGGPATGKARSSAFDQGQANAARAKEKLFGRSGD